jgi:integrase
MTGDKGKRRGKFTTREIESATILARNGEDRFLTDPGARGEGRFRCRCTPAGARLFYYRYTKASGERDSLSLGNYDPRGVDGLTLDEARRKAGELARLYQSGVRDLRAHLERADAAERQKHEAELAAKSAAARKAKRGSLAALVAAYVATLKGRPSQYDAGNILRNHVVEAFPNLAERSAASVTAEEFRDVLARLVEAEKGRTAAKCRSYMSAAYSVAMRAGLDPTVGSEFADFDIAHNPFDRLPSLAQFSRALNRVLTHAELVAFWRRALEFPARPARDALLCCVLLGGQRPVQLLRVTARDVDLDGATVVLHDIKGRGRHENPRRHVLPIPDDLHELLASRKRDCASHDDRVFGATRKETVGAVLNELCAAMADAGELENGPFQLRDIRRTVETHLAALGVSSDVRAQLQSHGLGGIQQRHYNRHEFMDEKRDALAKWAGRLVKAGPGRVIPITAGRNARAYERGSSKAIAQTVKR